MFGPLTVVLAAYSGSPAVSPKATNGAGDAALATVVDPAQSWQEPRMPVDCRVTGSFMFATQGRGGTEQAALIDLLDRVPDWRRARMRLYDDGCWRRPGHTFVVMHGQHGEYVYGGVRPSPVGGWATWVDGTCDPDRAGLLSDG